MQVGRDVVDRDVPPADPEHHERRHDRREDDGHEDVHREVAEQDLHHEEGAGERGVVGRRHAGRDAAAEEDRLPARPDLGPARHALGEGHAELDDRALAADRAAGREDDGRGGAARDGRCRVHLEAPQGDDLHQVGDPEGRGPAHEHAHDQRGDEPAGARDQEPLPRREAARGDQDAAAVPGRELLEHVHELLEPERAERAEAADDGGPDVDEGCPEQPGGGGARHAANLPAGRHRFQVPGRRARALRLREGAPAAPRGGERPARRASLRTFTSAGSSRAPPGSRARRARDPVG